MTDPQAIETLLYQARSAATHKPCQRLPCVVEFAGMPSRWCNHCLIAELLALLIAQAAQVEQLQNENQELRTRVAAGATTPGTGSTASSNQPLSPLPSGPDVVCEHGTAMDVHCCGCHSGFLFDVNKCICF